MTFGDRLDAIAAVRGRFCVGIDPHPELLSAWGLSDDAAGLDRFAGTVVEALGERIAVFKPQSAFFERHGSRGIAVLERTIADAKSAGALVLLDAKRGDIGSTMQAYADAYADPRSPLHADAVTVTPYLGFESLRPLLDAAARHGTGVFVVTLTSNPEGAEVQRAVPPGARDGASTVAGAMLDHVRAENAASGAGTVGAVIGATVGEVPADPDVGGPLLAPGLGAQGGTPADLRKVFGSALHQVLPSSSRQVLAAGPAPRGLQRAATSAAESCRSILDFA